MTEEHNIYHLDVPYNPLAAAASVTHVHPQIITLNATASPAPSMTISISEYNSLLDQFMARGDEITRLQQRIAQLVGDDEPLILDMPPRSSERGVAMVIDRGRAEPDLYLEVDDHEDEIARLQAVIRSAIHSLRARRDVAGTLAPCDELLLEELEKAIPGGAEVAHAPVSGKAFVQIEPGESETE